MIEKIVQTAKFAVNEIVDSHRALLCAEELISGDVIPTPASLSKLNFDGVMKGEMSKLVDLNQHLNRSRRTLTETIKTAYSVTPGIRIHHLCGSSFAILILTKVNFQIALLQNF